MSDKAYEEKQKEEIFNRLEAEYLEQKKKEKKEYEQFSFNEASCKERYK